MKISKEVNLNNLLDAITHALRAMEHCPDDSVQDIWNELLEEWETNLHMDRNYNLEINK